MLLLLLSCQPTFFEVPVPYAAPAGDGADDPAALDTADCYPVEFCDGADNDCDGAVDETFDLDGDGYLADEADCRAMGVAIDCDDTDPSVHPGAEELCDGIDNDCSGWIDDAPDGDGDGWGACDDCDDADPFVAPDAPEICDGIDNDCSGAADEIYDLDGDGVAGCAGDCDDADPYRGPHLEEVCDSLDNDCDEIVDEGFDADGDGQTTCRGDCDDDDPATYTGAPEICDGANNDCDATTREDEDSDGDGYAICDGDCDDADPASGPGASEVCDGADNDCDGYTDDDPACYDCVEEGDAWYCAAALDWDAAAAACVGFGGALAVVEGADHNEALGDGAGDYLGGIAWIALSDRASEGTWVWPDDTEPAVTFWSSGQPDGESSVHDCAGFLGNAGRWHDLNCSDSRPFICLF